MMKFVTPAEAGAQGFRRLAARGEFQRFGFPPPRE